MKHISITSKIIILGLILVIVPSLILGIVGYKSASKAVYDGVNERLMDQAKDWKLLIENYEKEITMQEQRVSISATRIVTGQAKITYELIDEFLMHGEFTDERKEELLNRLNRNLVGETGYTWILDYQGNYILSKGRQRDGENIWDIEDSDGNLVIQELISIGKELRGNEIDYYSYPWLNKAEIEPREKIAAILHFPELEWVVGISTYYDDLVDTEYRERTTEQLKNLISKQIIGRSGYIWVLNSSGHYIVSKNRLRDGENIWDVKDSDGNKVIQDLVRIGKSEELSYYSYPWLNKGEKIPRMKVAGMTYFEKWDWVIGVSAYYDDFKEEGSIKVVKNQLLFFTLILILLGIIISFYIGHKISRPIKELINVSNEINSGNFEVEIDIKSNDEIADLAASFESLYAGFKSKIKKSKKK